MRTSCRVRGCDKVVVSHRRCDRHDKQYKRRYVKGFREKEAAQHKQWAAANKSKVRRVQRAEWKRRMQRLRDQCYAAYGGYRCQCCGITIPEFLTLDHVKQDGNKHRRRLPKRGGEIYRWIVSHKFPPNMFQVLCFNCNCGRDRNGGVCPHQGEEKCHEKTC